MAVASKNQVRSLLIVANKPIEQIKTLALDSSSRSTQVLTRILCAEKWRIAPRFWEAVPDLPEMLHHADAALLIGDPALRISLGIEKDSWPGAPGQTVCRAATLGITSSELLHIYDVVGEWHALTGRPAVLAVWAVRKGINLGTDETTSAGNAGIRRPHRHRHGSAPNALEEERPACRDLPDRPQHQLYEFLHRVLFVLRVLPPARGERRLHSAVRGNLQKNRRDAGAWRYRNSAARRPASRSANRLLRKSLALFEGALPASASTLLFRAGNSVHRGSFRD